MNFRSPTWPQIVLFFGCLVFVIVAYRFLGSNAAVVVATALHLLTLMSNPKDPPPPPAPSGTPGPVLSPDAPKPPASPWRALVFASLMLAAGCAAAFGPAQDVTQIEACQAQGRLVKASDAGADAAYKAYDDCMRRNGYRADGGL